MEMKTRRTTKILAAFLVMILSISSCIVQSNVHVAQAAGKKSQVVENQAQLTKALKNSNLTNLVIQTRKSKKFSIPKGKYQNVTLIVKAPESDVTNRGVFKSITVTSMNKGSYTEAADGNAVRLAASKATFRVQAGYKVRKLTIVKKSTATFVLNGSIEALSVNARSTVKIKGTGGGAAVYLNKGGRKSTVETALPITLRLAADADVVLNEGGGESRIIVSKNNVNYSIKNNSKGEISLNTATGKKTLATGKTYQGKTSKNTPNGGIVVSGGGSSGGSSGGGSSGATVTDADKGGYTRGEWVLLLSKKLGFLLEGDVQEDLYYFSDTRGKSYGETAELAQAYGLLPESDAVRYEDPEQDVPMFEAEKKVTREYATYTVVKALGYMENDAKTLECSDKSGLKYGKVDAIGVEQGMIDLKNNQFLPNEVLDKKTGAAMLAKIDEINATTEVKEAVEKVTYDEKGHVASIDYAGVSVPHAEQSVVAEGVTRRTASGRSAGNALVGSVGFAAGGSVGVPDIYELTDKQIGNARVSGTVALSIPDITCKIKAERRAGRLEFDEFLLSVTNKAQVYTNLTCSPDGYEMMGATLAYQGGTAELVRIPCQIGEELSLDLIVSLEMQGKGNVEISCSIGAVQGMQIIDGQQRVLRDFSQSLEQLGAKGGFRTGLQLDCGIKAAGSEPAVADVRLSSGFEGKAAYVYRSDKQLYCGDGSVWLYGGMEIPQGSGLGDFLRPSRPSGVWNIFNRFNSPFLTSVHFENMKKVDECTYDKGFLEGTVININESRIAGAKVELMKGSDVLRNAISDAQGKFTFADVPVGAYTLKVKATGSLAYEVEVEVKPGRRTYVEACIMLDRSADAGDGRVIGDIINAVSGKPVTGASFTVRKNWNNTTGEAVYSGTAISRQFELSLPAGNYTIQFQANGYVDCDVNVAVIGGATISKTVAFAPALDVNDDRVRIVLTWGENPEDLDSHLVGYEPDEFHICYYNMEFRNASGMVANLDIDDRESYGPETVTFYEANQSGTYSYYVHDFSDRELDSCRRLSLSGAQVRVYQGPSLLDSFHVPSNEEGTLWHVFNFNLQTKELTPVNEMSYESNEDIIGGVSADATFGEEEKNSK